MNKLLIILLLSLLANISYARNNGFICITYLTKGGLLNNHKNNKFTKNDYEKLAAYVKKTSPNANFKGIKDIGLQQYARGLYSSDTKKYKTFSFPGVQVNFATLFHNGLIYLESGGDMETDLMLSYISVIGGKSGSKCIEME